MLGIHKLVFIAFKAQHDLKFAAAHPHTCSSGASMGQLSILPSSMLTGWRLSLQQLNVLQGVLWMFGCLQGAAGAQNSH
jgi:hypothetical protein